MNSVRDVALSLLVCVQAGLNLQCGSSHEPHSDQIAAEPGNPVTFYDETPHAPVLQTDNPSLGGTITFEDIGATGWYPSRRDPATGPCDHSSGSCCQTRHTLTHDSLTPWNEDLIMTLRGPMLVKQVAAYQPDKSNAFVWQRSSFWDSTNPTHMQGVAFKGNRTETNGFNGVVGNLCLVDVSTNRVFTTGPGSVPYCPPASDTKYYGWEGSKMIVVQARMPRVKAGVIDNAAHCNMDEGNNWYDAPWIGFSHAEMVRSGAFGSCHCYAKDPAKWWLADGCGQFNAFEVVNDNNDYQNFDLFSTNFFGYGGYVGEGPCGKNCTTTGLPETVDLYNKTTRSAATEGALANPHKGPQAAFRRPASGYRYFIVLFDVATRTVQIAMIHPSKIPPSVNGIFPSLPAQISRSDIENVLNLRLPAQDVGVVRQTN